MKSKGFRAVRFFFVGHMDLSVMECKFLFVLLIVFALRWDFEGFAVIGFELLQI